MWDLNSLNQVHWQVCEWLVDERSWIHFSMAYTVLITEKNDNCVNISKMVGNDTEYNPTSIISIAVSYRLVCFRIKLNNNSLTMKRGFS